jgi:hypothetical protein
MLLLYPNTGRLSAEQIQAIDSDSAKSYFQDSLVSVSRSKIEDQILFGLIQTLTAEQEFAESDIEVKCIDNIINLVEEFILYFIEENQCVVEWETRTIEENKFVYLKVENISENELILDKLKYDNRIYSIYRSRWHDRIYIVILPDSYLRDSDYEALFYHYQQLLSSDYPILFESAGKLLPLQICNYWKEENRFEENIASIDAKQKSSR